MVLPEHMGLSSLQQKQEKTSQKYLLKLHIQLNSLKYQESLTSKTHMVKDGTTKVILTGLVTLTMVLVTRTVHGVQHLTVK